MKGILLLASALAMSVAASAAKPMARSEDVVAACLWEVAPVSAANYLKMPEPSRYQDLGAIKPEYALKQRLDAACSDIAVSKGVKRPRSVSDRKLREALVRARPSTTHSSERDPKAFVCTRYFENDTDLKNPAEFRWGYGDDFAQSQLGSMSLVFAAKGGGGVSLSKTGGLQKCSFVQPDGSLKDA